MFCPNCGTQNSETASTCTKCGFNLKGAAAPKFKKVSLEIAKCNDEWVEWRDMETRTSAMIDVLIEGITAKER